MCSARPQILSCWQAFKVCWFSSMQPSLTRGCARSCTKFHYLRPGECIILRTCISMHTRCKQSSALCPPLGFFRGWTIIRSPPEGLTTSSSCNHSRARKQNHMCVEARLHNAPARIAVDKNQNPHGVIQWRRRDFHRDIESRVHTAGSTARASIRSHKQADNRKCCSQLETRNPA